MSTYLYPEYHEGKEPFTNSTTTSRFLLRLISKWCTPDLWETDHRETAEDATAYTGFYSPPDNGWREGLYHQHAFVLAKEHLPPTLDEFIQWAKANWERREVFKLGQDIGAGDITRETYLDAMQVLNKIVAAETHITAI